MYSVGWRIWAWIKLVKVWATLRWSDVQAILPQELRLIEGRLSTILRRTKASGPNRQVKELPVCVSEKAYFAKPTGLRPASICYNAMFATSETTSSRDLRATEPSITGWRATQMQW